MPVLAGGREHRKRVTLAASLDSVRMSGACDVTDRSTPYNACTFLDCVRVRESCLSLYTFLSKILSRTALVVTTSVISIRLNHTRRHFVYRLEFGSQPQVFSQGDENKWKPTSNFVGASQAKPWCAPEGNFYE